MSHLPPRIPVMTIGPGNAATLNLLLEQIEKQARKTPYGIVARSARGPDRSYPKLAIPVIIDGPARAA